MTHFMIFFFVLAVVLFSAHYAAYVSVVSFFGVTDIVHKRAFAGATFFLAVSFILASVMVSWQETWLTRGMYLLSGYWLGLFANLLLAIVAVWLVIGSCRLTGVQPKTAMIALICFVSAFLYSMYGAWNAEHPRIKNITVTIPNLPPQWRGKQIVQLSDVHLGHVHRADFMRNIAEKIRAVHPQMVVITGDLFDGSDGNLQALLQPLNDMGPGKGIFFVTGNHETFLGLDKVFEALKSTSLRILQDEVVDVDGLKVIGISYARRGEKKDIVGVLHSLEKDFTGKPNVFLYHAPVHIDEFAKSGVDLQLSGHTHRGQIFPFRYITNQLYKGYDHGIHRIGAYTLYTSTGVGTWGPDMRTGTTPEIVVITLQ